MTLFANLLYCLVMCRLLLLMKRLQYAVVVLLLSLLLHPITISDDKEPEHVEENVQEEDTEARALHIANVLGTSLEEAARKLNDEAEAEDDE